MLSCTSGRVLLRNNADVFGVQRIGIKIDDWLLATNRVNERHVLGTSLRRCVQVIDRQDHIRAVNNFLVCFELRVRLFGQVDAIQICAVLQHPKISLPQIGRPLRRLLFMRRRAKEHQVRIRFPQMVYLLSCIQSDAVVAGHEKLCHTLLPQPYDLLQQSQLHAAALLLVLVEAPFETHCILPENSTPQIFIHFHLPHAALLSNGLHFVFY